MPQTEPVVVPTPVVTPAPEPPKAEAIPQVTPPSTPVDGALMERWPAIVESVRGRKKLLAAALEHAKPLALSNGEISLGFTKGIFHQQITSERQSLEALLSEILQTPTRLKIVEQEPSEGGVASLAENNDRAYREAKDARLKQGREHPAVQRAISILGAEIELVNDLGGGSDS